MKLKSRYILLATICLLASNAAAGPQSVNSRRADAEQSESRVGNAEASAQPRLFDLKEVFKRVQDGDRQDKLLGLQELRRVAVENQLGDRKTDAMQLSSQLLYAADGEIANGAGDVLAWCGTDAAPLLIAALQSSDSGAQARAASALYTIAMVNKADVKKLDAAIPHLASLAHDGTRAARTNASAAILRMGPAAIPALITMLNREGPWPPVELAKALAGHGERSIPSLCESLQSDNVAVRRNAAFALLLFPSNAPDSLPYLERAALGPLTVAVNDHDVIVRERANDALGNLGSRAKPSLAVIVAALDQPDAPYSSIADAVRKIGPERQHTEILFDAAKRFSAKSKEKYSRPEQKFGAAIAAVGEEAIGRVRQAIHSESEIERRTGLFALLNLGPSAAPVVPDVIPIMNQGNALALDVLAAIGPKAADAVPDLIRHLEHDTSWQQSRSMRPMYSSRYARALRAIGPPAVPALLAGLKHESYLVRAGCLTAIADITREADIDVSLIEPHLQGERAVVRIAALNALVQHGDAPTVLPILENLSRDADPDVALAAKFAIEYLSRQKK